MPYVDDSFDGPRPKARPTSEPPGRVRFAAIGDAWNDMTRHWATWALAALVVFLANGALNPFVRGASSLVYHSPYHRFLYHRTSLRDAVSLGLSMVVNGILLGGMFRMALNQLRGKRLTLGDLLRFNHTVPEILLESLLAGLVIHAGFALMLFPGLVAAGVLMFALPLVIDGRATATQAITASWRALSGSWVQATVFHALAVLVASLGAIVCGVGVFLSAPIYVLAIASLYRDFFPEALVRKVG
jgi:hypothetical protein